MDYHGSRFEDHSLMVYKDKNLIGLFPANISGKKAVSHEGLTYGGFLINAKIRFTDVLSGFQGILQYFENMGIEHIELRLQPKIYHKSPADEIDYLLFKLKAERFRSDNLSVVVPSQSKYAKDRQQGIKRAGKNRLYIKEADDFKSFWNDILIPNLQNKFGSLPVHSLEEILLLKERFPAKIRLFLVYDHQELPVAGTVIFDTEKVARSQYISGNEDKNRLGSLDILHDHLLNVVFKDKPYFDFGKSNENQGQVINEGLLYWKEGFGARSVAHDYYKIDPSNHGNLKTVLI